VLSQPDADPFVDHSEALACHDLPASKYSTMTLRRASSHP